MELGVVVFRGQIVLNLAELDVHKYIQIRDLI